jgi:hypothetical protein
VLRFCREFSHSKDPQFGKTLDDVQNKAVKEKQKKKSKKQTRK